MRQLLSCAVKAAGGQTHWASQHGLSQQIVSDALSGRRRMSRALSRALGFEPMTVYAPSAVSKVASKRAAKYVAERL